MENDSCVVLSVLACTELILLRNRVILLGLHKHVNYTEHLLFIMDSFNRLLKFRNIRLKCKLLKGVWTFGGTFSYSHKVISLGKEAIRGKSKRWGLGGGVVKRWNDKHVTQNGNNQALLQTLRQSQGESCSFGWHTPKHTFTARHTSTSCSRRHDVRRRSITGFWSTLNRLVHWEAFRLFTCLLCP